MARRVFLGDCERCTRGYHPRVCRVTAERRTVSDTRPLNHRLTDECSTKAPRYLAVENTNSCRTGEGGHPTRVPYVGQPKQWNPLQNHGATTTRDTAEQRCFAEPTHQLPY